MNDDDLERRLRDESGPREQGYRASPLPDALDAPPSRARPSRAVRGAILASAVAAGVLAVAAASALISPSAPDSGVGVGPNETPTPTSSASPRHPTDCQPADLELTAEPWGGAAGSRGTVVNIKLMDGRYPCYLERHPGGQITNSNGEPLAAADVILISQPVLIQPGEVFTLGVSWSNWCGDLAGGFNLVLVSGDIEYPVDVPEGIGPVPPCLGENEPSVLNVTDLQPAD